jgi:O-glycosyl hydrolase
MLLASAHPARAATVTIDSSTQHQTIRGWGATSQCPEWVTAALRDEVIREIVNDFGLTRLRLEGLGGNRSNARRWEWLNDNADPEDINWSALSTSPFDQRIKEIVLPFKQRVEANGDPFDIYVSPSFFNGGSTGEVPGWLRYNPGEYAEFAISLLLRLRDVHGIQATYYCICNEAGNGNYFAAPLVADMIKTLGPKLQAMGFSTKIEFPECVSGQASWNYIQATQNDAEMWSHVGVVTYHLYGANDPYRSQIRDFAKARGLPTGQTEYMGLTMNHLYDDLTLGGVSYWEIYGIGSQIDWNYNIFARTGQYWSFRQVLHYARPGAVRIEAASDDPALRVLAFVRQTRMTVVLINGSGARSVTVNNLPAGTYGVCRSVNNAAYQELGLQTVGTTGSLTINVPSNTVLTIYPYLGSNQPPTPTNWKAGSDYLAAPASTTNLTASATDPELDPITYAWTIASQPPGANVALATPNAAQTQATGLSVPGDYAFNCAISDPTHTVNRAVRLTAFAGNQPPVPIDVHNRIPVMVILPNSTTQLRAGGWDLENDPLTYQWSIVSQPPGATANLSTPTQARCDLSNLTVPGDYVFRFELSDPTHTVSENLTVPVYPANPSAPVISSATASPNTLKLPDNRTSLTAMTSDPDGNMISHWWSVKSKPAGANPVFARQGSPNTSVSNLTQAGAYTFTLVVVDMTRYVTKDVTVTVEPGAAATRQSRAYD